MLAFSNDYYGFIFRATQSVELFCAYDICVFHGENAGVHFVLEFINGLTEQEAIDKARDVGIQVYGVSEYCISINTEKENKVLLGYAGMEEKEIEEAMKLLKKVWHKK